MKRIVYGLSLSVVVACFVGSVTARDLDGRYANSPLKPWFDHLASGKGLCCSMADGETVSDPDWDSKDGHYRVRLDGAWIEVPDDAVITEPNLFGRTMVWPVRFEGQNIEIRCFMPGSMTQHGGEFAANARETVATPMAELGPSVVSADLCGLRQEAVRIGKIGDHGNFGATVIAGVTGARDRAQQDIERICGHLRSKYRLAKF